MKPTLLVTIPLGQPILEKFAPRFDVTQDAAPSRDVQAILTMGHWVADSKFMDGFPNLKIIACIGSGYECIDLNAARARGIKVTNTAGANAAAVADLAVGLLLASMRHIVEGDQMIRSGEWTEGATTKLLFTPSVTGRRIGIIGLGSIGRKIGERMQAFETEIGYFNRSKKDDVAWPFFASPVELAKWADVLMVAHRADDTNRHMINAEVLNALGAEGHIINVSRGNAIDDEALIAALAERRIAGAGLDVFDDEPNVRPELIASPYTVLTPHLGGGTREAVMNMIGAVITNLNALFDGAPLPNEVV